MLADADPGLAYEISRLKPWSGTTGRCGETSTRLRTVPLVPHRIATLRFRTYSLRAAPDPAGQAPDPAGQAPDSYSPRHKAPDSKAPDGPVAGPGRL